MEGQGWMDGWMAISTKIQELEKEHHLRLDRRHNAGGRTLNLHNSRIDVTYAQRK